MNTNQLAITKKRKQLEKQLEIAQRKLYILKNTDYLSKTIFTINICIPLPKKMSCGILPTEIFEKIFDFVRAIEEREERERNYCSCDICEKIMSKQEFELQEQNALDEYNKFNPNDQIEEFDDGWADADFEDPPHYCSLQCRECLLNEDEVNECEECGDLCHSDYRMTGFGLFLEFRETENYSCICVNCDENPQ